MAVDATNVRLAPFGNVYLAPVGTAVPTNATMALNASLEAVGYVDEGGVSISPKVKLADINAWQSTTPVKKALDSVDLEVKFNMIEVNSTTWSYYFMNEPWSNNFGQAKLVVSSSPPTQELTMVIEWNDENDDDYRLVVPRAVLNDRDALTLDRKKATATGISLSVLDNSGEIFRVYSNNADLIPAT